MKIAIIGGGFTGLVTAEQLSKDVRNEVYVFESSSILGGLASGFGQDNWDWNLEKTYHHIFSSDHDIINYLHGIGFEDFIFQKPQTTSLYFEDNKYQMYGVDSPLNLLRFPRLKTLEKIRAGLVLAMLKISPFLKSIYESQSTAQLLSRTMGERASEQLFGQMLRKKFGKYAGNILASFFWARIKKRTQTLGYIKGGFQKAINHVANKCRENGATILCDSTVEKIVKNDEGRFSIKIANIDNHQNNMFDIVVLTIPSPTIASIATGVLSEVEIGKLRKLKYLAATNLIVETNKPIFDSAYWVSLCTNEVPGLVFVQHTNYMDKSHYGNHHILYIGNYCESDNKLMNMSKEDMLSMYYPHLQKISSNKFEIINTTLWRTKYAQPIFDKDFLQNYPHHVTSVRNCYIANLDMTYPYDRGTNYAVKLGKDVAQLVSQTIYN